MVEAFVPSAYFLQVLRRAALSQKMLRWRRRERLFEPTLRGCSSVVEHLLAKEDVASSSLVTRSSLRLVRSANRRLERARRSRGEGGSPDRIQATAGKPVRDFAVVYYVYILQSKSAPNQRYIGLTRDLKKRLLDHQDGHLRIPRNSLRGLSSRTSHLSLRTQPWHSRGILNLVPAAPSRNAIFGPIK